MKMVGMLRNASVSLSCRALRVARDAKRCLSGQEGQGTTEYAILVGVLVVIAIIAVTAFKGKIQELWDAIAEGINGL